MTGSRKEPTFNRPGGTGSGHRYNIGNTPKNMESSRGVPENKSDVDRLVDDKIDWFAMSELGIDIRSEDKWVKDTLRFARNLERQQTKRHELFGRVFFYLFTLALGLVGTTIAGTIPWKKILKIE